MTMNTPESHDHDHEHEHEHEHEAPVILYDEMTCPECETAGHSDSHNILITTKNATKPGGLVWCSCGKIYWAEKTPTHPDQFTYTLLHDAG